MSEFPAGWLPVKLGEVAEFKYGKALPAAVRDGGEFPVYGSNGVVGQHSTWLSPAPTIVIGRKGSVGEICFSEKNCSPIDTTYYVESFEFFEPKFCFYLLKTLRLSDLNKSTAIPGLNRQDAYDLEIGLPPFAEQTRIAQKLDELLAQVDTLKTRIDGIPALLRRFRQSVLTAAVSGRLTEEWREKNDTAAWGNKTLAGLSKRLHQGINTSADKVEYSETGTPILQAKHITSGEIVIGDARNVGKATLQKYQEKYCPPIGSILFTNIGTIGRSVVIHKNPNFLIAWNIFLIEPNSLVVPRYLQINLELLRATGYYESLYRGGATQFVNKKQLSEIDIPLPVTDEQVEIVRRVEQLFAFADQLETKVATAKSRIDHLTQSILAKAFRGELVPQDPNDEPASVLLARIQAQRAAAPKAKRGRKSA